MGLENNIKDTYPIYPGGRNKNQAGLFGRNYHSWSMVTENMKGELLTGRKHPKGNNL